jgi:hypothetical protein
MIGEEGNHDGGGEGDIVEHLAVPALPNRLHHPSVAVCPSFGGRPENSPGTDSAASWGVGGGARAPGGAATRTAIITSKRRIGALSPRRRQGRRGSLGRRSPVAVEGGACVCVCARVAEEDLTFFGAKPSHLISDMGGVPMCPLRVV